MDVRISVERTSEVERDINIEISRGLYDSKFNKALNDATSRVQLKGFRQGRAPRAMIAKLYGQRIHAEVVEGLISTALQDAVKEHSLRVVGNPQIKEIQDQDAASDLKVKAQVSVFPEPEITDLDGIAFETEVVEPEAGQLEKRLESMRESGAKFEQIEGDGVPSAGTIFVIDFEGSIDGKTFKGSKRENAIVEPGKGTQGIPPEIESVVPTMSLLEERLVSVTLPADIEPEELAGKSAEYKVKLQQAYRRELPPLDDEFAKKTGYAEDMDSLRKLLADTIERETKEKNRKAKEEKLFEEILKKNPFEVPQPLIDDEIRSMLFELRVLNPNDEKSREADVERFRPILGERAAFRVKQAVAIDRIVIQEKLEVTDEGLEDWLNNLAAESQQTREELNKEIGFPKQKRWLKNVVARQQMTDRLLEKAAITEVPKSEAEPAE